MANQTANRFYTYKEGLRQLAYNDATAVARYRGAAVGVLTHRTAGEADATSQGYLSSTFDGTKPVKFVGVNLLNVTSSVAGTSGYQRAIYREGAVEFVRTSTTDRWVGRPVWFSDDQTVALTPTGRWPIFAGYVIEDVGNTAVLVEITDAVRSNRPWQMIQFDCQAANITTVSGTKQLTTSGIGPAYIKQFSYNVPVAMSGNGAKAKVNMRLGRTNSATTTVLASSTMLHTSAITTGVIAVGASINHNDALNFFAYCSAASPMAKGRINGFIQVMPLT